MNNVNNQNKRFYLDLVFGNVIIMWLIFIFYCMILYLNFLFNFFNYSINLVLNYIYQNYYEGFIMLKYSIIFCVQIKC